MESEEDQCAVFVYLSEGVALPNMIVPKANNYTYIVAFCLTLAVCFA